MNLTLLCVLLGLGYAAPNILGLAKPDAFTRAARNFCRSEWCGWVLMAISTCWFIANLQRESIADFTSYKPAMYVGFALLGLGTCVYVKDFLSVRGFALILLLMAKSTLDAARWPDSQWRLVLVVWAYVWVVVGVWLTISPWRMRDYLQWRTATLVRVKQTSAAGLAFAILVIVLGCTALRVNANSALQ